MCNDGFEDLRSWKSFSHFKDLLLGNKCFQLINIEMTNYSDYQLHLECGVESLENGSVRGTDFCHLSNA